jgi:UMF1 family MFS transporter
MDAPSAERAFSRTQREGLGRLSWALYDFANQPFPTLIHTFVFSVYFTQSVAQSVEAGTAHWGTAVGLAGIVVAIAAPMLGAAADQGGRRKPWILGFTLLCVVATALMWSVQPSPSFAWLALVLVAVASVGSELALVFYNSLLPHLAPADRIGRWSGWGWGMGYAGGLVCLIVVLIFIRSGGAWLGLDAKAGEPVRATAIFVAAWYLMFALPFFLFTPDVAATDKPLKRALEDARDQLRGMLRNLRQHGPIMRFLLAHMIYIDGLGTVFAFGGIYAAGTFAISGEMVLVLGIALNIAAGAGAFVFAWVDDRIGSKATIVLALCGLIVSSTLIVLVTSSTLFWMLALMLGVFVGPAQAAGRSLMAQIAPEPLQNQMFGLFALSGKATAFVGPLLVGWITYLAGSQRIGMIVIIVFFVLGLAIMLTVPAADRLRRPSVS